MSRVFWKNFLVVEMEDLRSIGIGIGSILVVMMMKMEKCCVSLSTTTRAMADLF